MQIPTPTGSLEADFSHHASSNAHAGPVLAVLCHPHPQYGGSMHDAVLEQAAQCYPSTLRFNFRGVGESTGTFDSGVGEVDDVLYAWEWARNQHNWVKMVLIGYSFGAAMAWQAHTRCTDIERVILIAPPSAAMKFTDPTVSSDRGASRHVIAGSEDAYFDATQLPSNCLVSVIDGADHFFSDKLGDLRLAVKNAS